LRQALGKEGTLARWAERFVVKHPREALAELATELEQHPQWLD